MILQFPQMDAPAMSQHVHERMIPLHHVLFLTPHGKSKEKMSIPFTERTVLPTQLVLPDDLAGNKQSSIILQLHTPFSRTHLQCPIY